MACKKYAGITLYKREGHFALCRTDNKKEIPAELNSRIIQVVGTEFGVWAHVYGWVPVTVQEALDVVAQYNAAKQHKWGVISGQVAADLDAIDAIELLKASYVKSIKVKLDTEMPVLDDPTPNDSDENE